MIDGNEYALRKHQEEEDYNEKILSSFNEEIESMIVTIEYVSNEIRRVVSQYEREYNLDFSSDAEESMKEAIGAWR